MKKFWGAILLTTMLVSCKDGQAIKETGANEEIVKGESVEKPVIKYGFNLDEFTVQQDTIRNGDSFGELMIRNMVDYPKIAKVASDFKDTFDVRRMHPGKPYTILKSKDTCNQGPSFLSHYWRQPACRNRPWRRRGRMCCSSWWTT